MRPLAVASDSRNDLCKQERVCRVAGESIGWLGRRQAGKGSLCGGDCAIVVRYNEGCIVVGESGYVNVVDWLGSANENDSGCKCEDRRWCSILD